jgi:hypothetical protein
MNPPALFHRRRYRISPGGNYATDGDHGGRVFPVGYISAYRPREDGPNMGVHDTDIARAVLAEYD